MCASSTNLPSKLPSPFLLLSRDCLSLPLSLSKVTCCFFGILREQKAVCSSSVVPPSVCFDARAEWLSFLPVLLVSRLLEIRWQRRPLDSSFVSDAPLPSADGALSSVSLVETLVACSVPVSLCFLPYFLFSPTDSSGFVEGSEGVFVVYGAICLRSSPLIYAIHVTGFLFVCILAYIHPAPGCRVPWWEEKKSSISSMFSLPWCRSRNGELWDLLKHGGILTESLAARYILQLVDAVEYVHSKGIVHRDIKVSVSCHPVWVNPLPIFSVSFAWPQSAPNSRQKRRFSSDTHAESFCFFVVSSPSSEGFFTSFHSAFTAELVPFILLLFSPRPDCASSAETPFLSSRF